MSLPHTVTCHCQMLLGIENLQIEKVIGEETKSVCSRDGNAWHSQPTYRSSPGDRSSHEYIFRRAEKVIKRKKTENKKKFKCAGTHNTTCPPPPEWRNATVPTHIKQTKQQKNRTTHMVKEGRSPQVSCLKWECPARWHILCALSSWVS